MNRLQQQLAAHPQVSAYKISHSHKQSHELFYVKGKLETLRRTDTNDREVTVYVDHDGCRGDAQFNVYASTTDEQLTALIDQAVARALLIHNAPYELPPAETGSYEVASNFPQYDPAALAQRIAQLVFAANTVEHAALNAVEIFLTRHSDTVVNSNGLDKTQVWYEAMVEAIPTYNGERQSVELYEQYLFSSLDEEALTREIAGKMAEVQARYEAVRPEFAIDCPVVLNRQEVSELMWNIAGDLNYATVYGHANLFHKGDEVQSAPTGDVISLTMAGQVPGSARSACFDADGLSLGSVQVVEQGRVVRYHGANRYGQYLGEQPTGVMNCLRAAPGTAEDDCLAGQPYLEIVSMSGLQVDFYSDYIGGEVRLAYYHDGARCIPVTGISLSGKLRTALSQLRLSRRTAVYRDYEGPAQAILYQMTVF